MATEGQGLGATGQRFGHHPETPREQGWVSKDKQLSAGVSLLPSHQMARVHSFTSVRPGWRLHQACPFTPPQSTHGRLRPQGSGSWGLWFHLFPGSAGSAVVGPGTESCFMGPREQGMGAMEDMQRWAWSTCCRPGGPPQPHNT